MPFRVQNLSHSQSGWVTVESVKSLANRVTGMEEVEDVTVSGMESQWVTWLQFEFSE
jgi:hypothetical protein